MSEHSAGGGLKESAVETVNQLLASTNISYSEVGDSFARFVQDSLARFVQDMC